MDCVRMQVAEGAMFQVQRGKRAGIVAGRMSTGWIAAHGAKVIRQIGRSLP